MPYELTLKGHILELREEEIINCQTLRVTYFYTDVRDWRKSALGRKREVPLIPMTESEIRWCRQHYFPKVGLPSEGPYEHLLQKHFDEPDGKKYVTFLLSGNDPWARATLELNDWDVREVHQLIQTMNKEEKGRDPLQRRPIAFYLHNTDVRTGKHLDRSMTWWLPFEAEVP